MAARTKKQPAEPSDVELAATRLAEREAALAKREAALEREAALAKREAALAKREADEDDDEEEEEDADEEGLGEATTFDRVCAMLDGGRGGVVTAKVWRIPERGDREYVCTLRDLTADDVDEIEEKIKTLYPCKETTRYHADVRVGGQFAGPCNFTVRGTAPTQNGAINGAAAETVAAPGAPAALSPEIKADLARLAALEAETRRREDRDYLLRELERRIPAAPIAPPAREKSSSDTIVEEFAKKAINPPKSAEDPRIELLEQQLKETKKANEELAKRLDDDRREAEKKERDRFEKQVMTQLEEIKRGAKKRKKGIFGTLGGPVLEIVAFDNALSKIKERAEEQGEDGGFLKSLVEDVAEPFKDYIRKTAKQVGKKAAKLAEQAQAEAEKRVDAAATQAGKPPRKQGDPFPVEELPKDWGAWLDVAISQPNAVLDVEFVRTSLGKFGREIQTASTLLNASELLVFAEQTLGKTARVFLEGKADIVAAILARIPQLRETLAKVHGAPAPAPASAPPGTPTPPEVSPAAASTPGSATSATTTAVETPGAPPPAPAEPTEPKTFPEWLLFALNDPNATGDEVFVRAMLERFPEETKAAAGIFNASELLVLVVQRLGAEARAGLEKAPVNVRNEVLARIARLRKMIELIEKTPPEPKKPAAPETPASSGAAEPERKADAAPGAPPSPPGEKP